MRFVVHVAPRHREFFRRLVIVVECELVKNRRGQRRTRSGKGNDVGPIGNAVSVLRSDTEVIRCVVTIRGRKTRSFVLAHILRSRPGYAVVRELNAVMRFVVHVAPSHREFFRRLVVIGERDLVKNRRGQGRSDEGRDFGGFAAVSVRRANAVRVGLADNELVRRPFAFTVFERRDRRPRFVDELFDDVNSCGLGVPSQRRFREGRRSEDDLELRLRRDVADGKLFLLRGRGRAVSVASDDFEVIGFAVNETFDRRGRGFDGLRRNRDEGRFAGFGVDGFSVNRNGIVDDGFDSGFGRGFPSQFRGRSFGRLFCDGQAGRRGGNVRGYDGNLGARGFARVVKGDDAVNVGRVEFEFVGRPGRRIGGEAFGRVDPSAVCVERLNDVTAFVGDVRPSQRNLLFARFKRFEGQLRLGQFRRDRRVDRRKLQSGVFPLGGDVPIVETVGDTDGANLT